MFEIKLVKQGLSMVQITRSRCVPSHCWWCGQCWGGWGAVVTHPGHVFFPWLEVFDGMEAPPTEWWGPWGNLSRRELSILGGETGP